MRRVLILTKTNWNEAPRIRHQITRLLKDRGFQIVYIEKNSYRNLLVSHRFEEGMEFYAHSELIHHQLRYFPIIQKANNLVVKFYLRRILKRIEFDFIINFCYDYSFLKTLAPGKKVITVIEDDFESQAKFGMTRQIRNQVAATCKMSDSVLTVSYPLLDKLVKYKDNVVLLFPWSQRKYKRPNHSHERNTVLYFGYVHRLQWGIIQRLVTETKYRYRFVGPTAKSIDVKMVNHLMETCTNFEYIPFSSVNDLKVEDVFCSILPYDPSIQSVQACTVSNRAFNILSLGLPLAYADLHHLIKAPEVVIRKNKSVDDYIKTLDFFQKNFYDIQPDIEKFLSDHYENDRWRILEEVIAR